MTHEYDLLPFVVVYREENRTACQNYYDRGDSAVNRFVSYCELTVVWRVTETAAIYGKMYWRIFLRMKKFCESIFGNISWERRKYLLRDKMFSPFRNMMR